MGSKGYPNLTDRDWLWGGDAETVAQTIRAGINSSDENTRVSQMPSFGRDGMLDDKAIFAVSQYVLSLSNPGAVKGTPAGTIRTGAKVFTDNCAACHGPKGLGDHSTGAPNLTDNIWLYGGDAQTIYTTVYDGRRGEMPAWSPRLSASVIKILTLYVLDRGGPAQ
jgi:cytochrome c oxidase cbb3-type subunit 3